MKIETIHRIGLFDIDYRFRLKIETAARLFQDIAVRHSTQIGAGPEVLFKKGKVWFLARLEMAFSQYPVLGEDIRVTTWSRGFKGFKGFREYRLSSDRGEVARGSGVWLFYDFKHKRIAKVPPEISDLYQVEPEKGFDHEVDDWAPPGKIHPDHAMTVTLRYSDFDVNGHVNNTVYLGLLESLYHKHLNPDGRPVGNIRIRFSREIDRTREEIRVSARRQAGVIHCNIHDESVLYADADIVPMQ